MIRAYIQQHLWNNGKEKTAKLALKVLTTVPPDYLDEKFEIEEEADITKRLGIIGGLGPLATAYFYELITRMTDAKTDQEHIEAIIFSKPTIPDRTAYIIGKSWRNPIYDMLEAGQLLVNMGVELIAIPCITAHYYYDTLSEKIKVPVIHVVRETARYLKANGVRCAGILASEGTIRSGLFQKELDLSEIKMVIPKEDKQQQITDMIYQCIKADKPIDFKVFCSCSEQLREDGAEVIILGCTELSLIKRDFMLGPGFLDAMEVLAMRAVLSSEARLKEDYTSLITDGTAGKVYDNAEKYNGILGANC